MPRRKQGRFRHALCLDDFEQLGRRHLPRPIFGYVSGAAETNSSLADNRAAFAELGFVPRSLIDVSKRTMTARLLGREYAAPFGIAPMGISALVAYRGDLVLARSAAAERIPMIMSGSSLIPLEEVRSANPDAWFQAYLPGDAERIIGLVDRVERAGFGTLVITVDTPVRANRENNVRNGFSTPLRPSLRLLLDGMLRPRWTCGTFLRTFARHGMPYFENSFAHRGAPILSQSVERDFRAKDHLNWAHLDIIRKRWKGHLVIKGLMSAEDAVIARERGVDAVIVSNHGGRQLDGTLSPLRVLPTIVAAVGGSMPVMLDGGVRRGTDVLKALALGATFVFVGRPLLYACAVGGEEGVSYAIGLLKAEIARNMGMMGVNSLQEDFSDRVVPRSRFSMA
ncbi:alpha-hydroxy-acid oxidizing protein [Aureimonas altamirensis]|uniref:alpha-hydroxy acid oxidase n=1 Tax=Aureimonas altamirensis TaxID=370622 RepID=UPI0020366B0E|nr:alpha-hydroxy acid oxidase [Aureimonas altamirensis]MCM2502827.1 alpha-hydroxy-acid oxidizing protein [Aureimonas altamirensis]